MFSIDPNAVYSKKDLIEVTQMSHNTIDKWYKSGLKHRERYTTGRALLDYFEAIQEDVISEIEMSNYIELRPIYHYKENSVKAHIFICFLSYLLLQTLENKLRAIDSEYSAYKFIEKTKKISMATIKVGKENIMTSISLFIISKNSSDLFHALLKLYGIIILHPLYHKSSY